MEVMRGIKNTLLTKPLGIGLGNFDGLHIGHITLINALINESRLNDLHSMIYTFAKHPENILKKELITPLLITVEKKAELLSSLPLDYLYYEDFDESFSKMQPEDFVKDILVGNFNIKLAMAGFDYTFGYRGRGDAKLLKELGEKHNFRVIIIPPIKINDEVISSTLIREYLTSGDMEKTFYFLGRHYSITGLVEGGHRMGSELGFPTANINPEEYLLLPAHGVYITKTLLDGKLHKSVTNIGMAPTIKTGRTRVNIETYILDFNGDIYQKNIEVFFIKKIRDEKKFGSKE
ncbi:MAG TPA: bifunctional riboflavin kinase/FAD synthetase, partial [Clostridiales bacterium]|nr:bifunctional riboflavin kinase/FAD synthetase [Clostridiales bacterium]